jgi:hypothetical protein
MDIHVSIAGTSWCRAGYDSMLLESVLLRDQRRSDSQKHHPDNNREYNT